MGESFQKAVKPIIDFIRILESALRVMDNVVKITEALNAVKATSAALTEKDTVKTATNTVAKLFNAGASEKENLADKKGIGIKIADTWATIKNTAAKVANAIASAVSWLVATLGPLGIVAAVGAVAGIIALISKGTKQAGEAAKMADGGIVPAGYPNDSYPAMLSSGETVIPPGKLPENVFDRNNGRVEKVELVAKGKDMYALLHIQGKLMQTY